MVDKEDKPADGVNLSNHDSSDWSEQSFDSADIKDLPHNIPNQLSAHEKHEQGVTRILKFSRRKQKETCDKSKAVF